MEGLDLGGRPSLSDGDGELLSGLRGASPHSTAGAALTSMKDALM